MDFGSLEMVFEHILQGYDIPKPDAVLRISGKRAAQRLEELPYSLLTNLQHAVLWQRFWLGKLQGGRRHSGMEEWRNDFRVPEVAEFSSLRAEFLAGLQEAYAICRKEWEPAAGVTEKETAFALSQIAVHAAYHLGQMNLLKRALKNVEE